MDSNAIWMFFNCDKEMSTASMNPLYNTEVYRKKRHGRRALWKKIKSEIADEKIIVNKDDMHDIREAIINGDPVDANEYMTYGLIVELTESE